jgi:hypothetical protein
VASLDWNEGLRRSENVVKRKCDGSWYIGGLDTGIIHQCMERVVVKIINANSKARSRKAQLAANPESYRQLRLVSGLSQYSLRCAGRSTNSGAHTDERAKQGYVDDKALCSKMHVSQTCKTRSRFLLVCLVGRVVHVMAESIVG